MKRGRLLLPWGLLAGLLIWTAAIEGLSIKAPSLLKKPRNITTNLSTTTTTTEPTELSEPLGEDEEETGDEETEPEAAGGNVTAKSRLTGDPQKDYRFDPNLPRELPNGYNLSAYPFFSRVPADVAFECGDELLDGYYANVHYKCQVYHHCLSGIRYDFLCANYTAFDQKTFICHFVSEVDCVNSAKFWNRNKGLYETPTTSTVKPLTLAPPPATVAAPAVPARRPGAAGSSRRRRPYRRRRPQYDYYYDDEYDEDEYEDDVTGPGQGASRGSGGSQRSRPSIAEPPTDDKPFKADKSIYDRPRQAPQIRRPVPLTERDKYEYAAKEGDKTSPREPERKRPNEGGGGYSKPREASSGRGRQKARPAVSASDLDDEEYYEDEVDAVDVDDDDYELPRTPSRKQHSQDYFGAPSGGDRDFARRPAMSGQGRPLRRNRPGARRKPVQDDDYYEDERRSRPTAPDSDSRRRPQADHEPPRRRPDTEARRRPSQAADETPRRRPAQAADEAPRRRPSNPDRRPAESEEDLPPRKKADEQPRRRPQLDDEVVARKRPAEEEVPARRRPVEEEEPARRPVGSSSRRRNPQRDDYEQAASYERPADRDRPVRDRPAGGRESSAKDKDRTRAGPLAADEIPLSTYPRETTPRARLAPTHEHTSARAAGGNSRDYVDDRPAAERSRPTAEAARPLLTIPTGSGTATVVRTRGHAASSKAKSKGPDDADYDPIPAAKPAYISATGRGGTTYRNRQEEEAVRLPVSPTGSAGGSVRGSLRNAAKPAVTTTTTTTTSTEEPLLDDEEYYDDDEVVLEEELPGRPTGPEKSVGGVKQEAIPAAKQEALKPLRSRPTGRDEEFAEESARVSTNAGSRRTDKEAIDVRQGGKEENGDKSIADKPRPSEATSGQKHSSSSSYRFNEDGVLLETLPARQGFRPKSMTTTTTTTQASVESRPTYDQVTTEQPQEDVHQRPTFQSNYRRKANQASNIESTKVLAPLDDVRAVPPENVDIGPSGLGSYSTGTSSEGDSTPVKPTDAPIRLETEAFHVAAPKPAYVSLPPTGPSGRGSLNFRKNTPRPQDEFPRRAVLPDIGDPEYDVTLNEAIHPTQAPFAGNGDARTKASYNDYPSGGGKQAATLQSSASQTHEAKAPFPLHDKVTYEQDYEAVGDDEEDYEDPPIPTGRGAEVQRVEDSPIPTGRGSTLRYEWTTSNPMVFRGSEASLPPSRATTPSHQYYRQPQVTSQQSQQSVAAPNAGRGSTREFEQQVYVPTRNANQQFYKAAAAVSLRDAAELYRGSQNPLVFSQSYDYDLAPKYRPRRKYFSTGVQDYFGKLY